MITLTNGIMTKTDKAPVKLDDKIALTLEDLISLVNNDEVKIDSQKLIDAIESDESTAEFNKPIQQEQDRRLRVLKYLGEQFSDVYLKQATAHEFVIKLSNLECITKAKHKSVFNRKEYQYLSESELKNKEVRQFYAEQFIFLKNVMVGACSSYSQTAYEKRKDFIITTNLYDHCYKVMLNAFNAMPIKHKRSFTSNTVFNEVMEDLRKQVA